MHSPACRVKESRRGKAITVRRSCLAPIGLASGQGPTKGSFSGRLGRLGSWPFCVKGPKGGLAVSRPRRRRSGRTAALASEGNFCLARGGASARLRQAIQVGQAVCAAGLGASRGRRAPSGAWQVLLRLCKKVIKASQAKANSSFGLSCQSRPLSPTAISERDGRPASEVAAEGER